LSKYSNVATNVEGKSFASKLEAKRYQELLLLERAGELTNLQTQVTYRLEVNGSLICKYIADFVYDDRNGLQIVEDTKGYITPEFRLKKKLMKACLGIDIELVFATRKVAGRKWGR
jgi:hypothetical protein